MKTATITLPSGTAVSVDYTVSIEPRRIDYFSIEAPIDVILSEADEMFILSELEETIR